MWLRVAGTPPVFGHSDESAWKTRADDRVGPSERVGHLDADLEIDLAIQIEGHKSSRSRQWGRLVERPHFTARLRDDSREGVLARATTNDGGRLRRDVFEADGECHLPFSFEDADGFRCATYWADSVEA